MEETKELKNGLTEMYARVVNIQVKQSKIRKKLFLFYFWKWFFFSILKRVLITASIITFIYLNGISVQITIRNGEMFSPY